MRVVTMITPKNIEQLEAIADWVNFIGIESYGLSSITPMGRSNLLDRHNLLLKYEGDLIKCSEVISKIKDKHGEKFLYEVKDGDSKLKNCGAFTSNPSVTPNGDIKFCAMYDQTLIKSFGNVFENNIGELYTRKYNILNMIRNIESPRYDSEECKECSSKFFCSYCIIRGLNAAKEKGYDVCQWYFKKVPDDFKEMIL